MDAMSRHSFFEPIPSRFDIGDHTRPSQGSARPTASVSRRLDAAKRGFCLRRLDLRVTTLLERQYVPEVGSLFLARVTQIGQHDRIELSDGRYARLYVGDEILACYGDRDADHTVSSEISVRVPEHMQDCVLATDGGLAGEPIDGRAATGRPTVLQPIGMLGDLSGAPLNLSRFALPAAERCMANAPVFVVLGTGLDGEASTMAADTIRGLTCAGLRVAAAQVVGPGAGVDYWQMVDAGAVAVRDFGDCGLPSTFRVSVDSLRRTFYALVSELERSAPDAIVIEISAGACRREAEAILTAPWFARHVDRVLVDAPDAVPLLRYVALAREHGLRVVAVGGPIVHGPAALAQATERAGFRMLSQRELHDPSVLTPLLFT